MTACARALFSGSEEYLRTWAGLSHSVLTGEPTGWTFPNEFRASLAGLRWRIVNSVAIPIVR
jgi:hypothetical protein